MFSALVEPWKWCESLAKRNIIFLVESVDEKKLPWFLGMLDVSR